MADAARVRPGGSASAEGDPGRYQPASACLYPVGDQPGVRELSCEGHRVMYEVDPDTGRNDSAGDMLLLRVFGPGQDRSTP